MTFKSSPECSRRERREQFHEQMQDGRMDTHMREETNWRGVKRDRQFAGRPFDVKAWDRMHREAEDATIFHPHKSSQVK